MIIIFTHIQGVWLRPPFETTPSTHLVGVFAQADAHVKLGLSLLKIAAIAVLSVAMELILHMALVPFEGAEKNTPQYQNNECAI